MAIGDITINGTTYPRPVNFAPMRKDVYAAEYTTMSGSFRGDSIGWKYDDIELKWDALVHAQAQALANLPLTFTIVFDDPSGTHTETVRRISSVATRYRYTQNNLHYWKNVSVKLSFVDMHSYS